MSNTIATEPIMTLLRQATATLHDEIEKGRFNRDLIHGRLPLLAYAASLQQSLVIQARLEEALHCHRASANEIRSVVQDYHFQQGLLREDLASLGTAQHDSGLLESTRKFIAFIDSLDASDPVALLGILYVFEGSKNGGKFLAEAVRQAYDLSSPQGTRYLDPYGADQQMRWRQFKEDMNALALSDTQAGAICNASVETFRHMIRLYDELFEAAAAHEPSAIQAYQASGGPVM